MSQAVILSDNLKLGLIWQVEGYKPKSLFDIQTFNLVYAHSLEFSKLMNNSTLNAAWALITATSE